MRASVAACGVCFNSLILQRVQAHATSPIGFGRITRVHAVALQKQSDPNPLMRPHVRHVVEALEEATDILNNILAA
jgi:hypothetical protein